MELWKFRDLLTGRMYFRRADLFEDESEGLPLDEYWATLSLNLGFDAQIRQSYFIACWYLGRNEQIRMWRGAAGLEHVDAVERDLVDIPILIAERHGELRAGENLHGTHMLDAPQHLSAVSPDFSDFDALAHVLTDQVCLAVAFGDESVELLFRRLYGLSAHADE